MQAAVSLSGPGLTPDTLEVIANQAASVSVTEEAIERAAMATRLNGLCAGGSGAGESVALTLAAMLNAGVHPVVPRYGSIGASDLCLLAHVGLVVAGEGEADYDGRRLPGGEALAAACWSGRSRRWRCRWKAFGPA